MARAKLEVNREILVRALTRAEANGPLENQSKLWNSACSIYNQQKIPCPITPVVVMLRAKEWGIQVKTLPGKRGGGRKSGVPLSDEQKAALQAGRKRRGEHPQKEAWIAAQREKLRINGALRLLPLVESAAKGRRKAQDKLFCMECCGYSSKEVRLCSDIGCPKWLGRPFQQAQTDEEIAAEEIAAEEIAAEETSEDA